MLDLKLIYNNLFSKLIERCNSQKMANSVCQLGFKWLGHGPRSSPRSKVLVVM